ncbi:MAG: hypothetical protein IT258_16185 [Saprospiraceae bacterium]|nr:hypothetical protein [Saprospiraceae bacterium]
MNRSLACLLLAFLPIFGFSQNYWEVNVTPGVMAYYGDLTVPDIKFREAHFAGQLNLKRYFKGEHAIRVNVLHGTISGDDNNFDRNRGRGNKFTGQLSEFSIMGELDMKGRKRYNKKGDYNKVGSFYLVMGFAGTYCKPEVSYGNPENQDASISYPAWHFAVPIGGGFKFDLNEHLFLGAEFGMRLTLSDYLDGTQESGNAFKNDAYGFGGVSLGYRFDKHMKSSRVQSF